MQEVKQSVTDIGGFLEPERIVRYFDLQKGDHVADFGVGHGYFAILMARLVGGNGRIYAIDIQKSTLDIVRAKAKVDNLLNIEPVWADLEDANGSRLKDKFIDFVLVASILFQAEKKEVMIKEAHRILREGGRMAVIEWDDNAKDPLGPPLPYRIKEEEVKELVLRAGFKLDREFEAGSKHYGLLFKKL